MIDSRAMDYVVISAADIASLDGLADWRFALNEIHAEFRAPSFAAAGDLIASIIDASERADHHPSLALRYPGRVWVSLSTHVTAGITTHDVDLAREISALAAAMGAGSSPDRVQVVELAIDSMDPAAIRPFWAAVLGYEDDGRDNLVDPRGRGPTIWFQQMAEPRTERNRFHLDVSVPHDEAEARVEASLAAGGRLVSDARARAFWILADPDGNEVCICTWQDRHPPRP